MKMSFQACKILKALKANAEANTVIDENGHVWASVYEYNAKPANISDIDFAGYLQALKEIGIYKSNGKCFGIVLVM